MVVSGQSVSVKPRCQSNDKHKDAKKEQDVVPESWQLTAQQQAFIDSFSVEDDKKR